MSLQWIYRGGRGNWKQAEKSTEDELNKRSWAEKKRKRVKKIIAARKSLPVKWTKFSWYFFATQKNVEFSSAFFFFLFSFF